MDKFHDRQHVRLRSRVHGTYLHANSDGRSVSLRATLETAWTVHVYHGEGDAVYLLLHSAAYGRYLSATATRAPLGHLGFRAELRDYDQPEVEAIMWQAVEAGSGDGEDVMLRNAGGRYLRANGRHLPWNNCVTVDDNVSAMMYWTVEPIPAREGPPGLPGPIHTPSPGYHSLMLWRNPAVSRPIRFMSGTPVNLDELARRITFVLDGRQSFDLIMCLPAGRQGRLTPLVVDLPSSGYGETLWNAVFMSGTTVNLDKLARRIAFVLDGRQSFDLVMAGQGRLTPLVVDLPSSRYGETLRNAVFMSGTTDGTAMQGSIGLIMSASARDEDAMIPCPTDIAEAEMPRHIDYARVDRSLRHNFGLLPEEILCTIAQSAARCRCSMVAMRGVCRSWRSAVPPPTRGPLLVLSSLRPDQPTLFLAIVAGSLVPQQNPLFLPPPGSRCWGSCNGLLGLRVAARTGLTLCPNCGPCYPLPEIAEDVVLNNLCETPQLVCAFATDNPTAIWWTRRGEEQHWSVSQYGFGLFPKSIYWANELSVACIAAAPSSLIVDTAFEQRLLPIPYELQEDLDYLGIEHEHPEAYVIDFVMEEDPLLAPWESRSHHVFHIEQDIYICILLRHTQNNSVQARLYIFNLDGQIASMIPADNIGNNALFLGGNQAFVTAAGPELIPNTAYVINDDSIVRLPQVLRINFATRETTVMEYPPGVGPMTSYMPPSWLEPMPAVHCT